MSVRVREACVITNYSDPFRIYFHWFSHCRLSDYISITPFPSTWPERFMCELNRLLKYQFFKVRRQLLFSWIKPKKSIFFKVITRLSLINNPTPTNSVIKGSFCAISKVIWFYYFKWNSIQSKRTLTGAIYNQTTELNSHNQKVWICSIQKWVYLIHGKWIDT